MTTTENNVPQYKCNRCKTVGVPRQARSKINVRVTLSDGSTATEPRFFTVTNIVCPTCQQVVRRDINNISTQEAQKWQAR